MEATTRLPNFPNRFSSSTLMVYVCRIMLHKYVYNSQFECTNLSTVTVHLMLWWLTVNSDCMDFIRVWYVGVSIPCRCEVYEYLAGDNCHDSVLVLYK